MKFGTRYRIVCYAAAYFCVEVWCWWWPFWTQEGYGHFTLDEARQYARRLQNPSNAPNPVVVEELT